jgi:predicted MPP superfamily phosphohydrolase
LEIVSPKIRRPVRIAVIADFQTDHIGAYERRVVGRVIDEKPDLVLYAGDYLQAPSARMEELTGEFRNLVERISRETSSSAFAVGGNVDGWLWTTLFDGLDVTAAAGTETFESNGLDITCLSLHDSANPRLRIGRVSNERFHIVLGHIPNFALGPVDADLLLAGHTHGGQFRLPLFGPLVTHSAIPRGWAAGMTLLPDGGRLVVSRGVGLEREDAPRFRFCCRPEVVIIDLVPEK